jgi:hypothetical protein
MNSNVPFLRASSRDSRSTRPPCGGQAPTSARDAHSRTAADPSDPSLGSFATRQVTEYKHLDSLK